jgi:hypothetical protein
VFDATFSNISAASWRARLCKLQKGCTRLAAESDKVYQFSCLPMVGGSLQLLPSLYDYINKTIFIHPKIQLYSLNGLIDFWCLMPLSDVECL